MWSCSCLSFPLLTTYFVGDVFCNGAHQSIFQITTVVKRYYWSMGDHLSTCGWHILSKVLQGHFYHAAMCFRSIWNHRWCHLSSHKGSFLFSPVRRPPQTGWEIQERWKHPGTLSCLSLGRCIVMKVGCRVPIPCLTWFRMSTCCDVLICSEGFVRTRHHLQYTWEKGGVSNYRLPESKEVR